MKPKDIEVSFMFQWISQVEKVHTIIFQFLAGSVLKPGDHLSLSLIQFIRLPVFIKFIFHILLAPW